MFLLNYPEYQINTAFTFNCEFDAGSSRVGYLATEEYLKFFCAAFTTLPGSFWNLWKVHLHWLSSGSGMCAHITNDLSKLPTTNNTLGPLDTLLA